MDEDRADQLFARYVEHLVIEGARLPLEELASGDLELIAALQSRIQAFQNMDDALSRRAVLVGRTVGHYQVLESLGSGGMGEVYRAEDLTLGREVAIKVLPRPFALDPQRRTRFEREAKLLAALNRPNIGSIYGFERSDDFAFLVLELITGETLSERIARGALPLPEALRLFRKSRSPWKGLTARGLSTGTSSPPTSRSRPRATRRCWTSAWARRCRPQPRAGGPARRSTASDAR